MFGLHSLSGILAKPALYLDPGSGSFILQVLLASLLGAAFAIKVYWAKIKSIFIKTPPTESDDEESNEETK
ncbi:MAG: hypothetical protein WCG34_08840 [Leptolinea sp.]